MKALLAALMMITATAAQAEVETYELQNLNIDGNSFRLPKAHEVTSAHMEIDHDSREIRLEFNRRFRCPRNAVCAMVMPAPIQITLPLVYESSPFCGGRILTGQIDQRPADGTFIGIEVFDDNGNICDRNRLPVQKPLHIRIIEVGPFSTVPFTSTMTGSEVVLTL